ncbi:MAG TPA: LPXTG cell wall anchor domain-containing protein [Nocardioidaceae bacterium]|nr:LPXTG cell wall anchor domain-containing protein [Nocardioidaceae bacterium]
MSLGFGGYAWAGTGNATGSATLPAQAEQPDGSPGNADAYGQADGTANGATSQGAVSPQAVSSQAEGQGGSTNASPNGAEHASSNSQAANGATSQGTESQARLAVTSASFTTTADAPGKSDHSTGNAGTAGPSYDQPQQLSNADRNPGGANGDCGAYCSTRNGDPSGNGKGDDKGANASGKPCAGCVGKADNKNPPGQFQNGNDHNAGYECDRNQGIGQTNPAHTGCTDDTDTCQQLGNCTCEQLGNCTGKTCEELGNCTCEQLGNCPGKTCEQLGNCTCEQLGNCTGKTCEQLGNCTCEQLDNCPGKTCEQLGNCPPGGCKPGCDNGTPPGPETLTCTGGQVMHHGICACPNEQVMVNGQCEGPDIAGEQVFRPKPQVVVGPPVTAPAATGLPNTGADSGLGLDAMAGAGMLIAGGGLLLLRRRLARR